MLFVCFAVKFSLREGYVVIALGIGLGCWIGPKSYTKPLCVCVGIAYIRLVVCN